MQTQLTGQHGAYTITAAPGGFDVAFGYAPDRVAAIKEIAGRRFNGATKSWFIPKSSAGALEALVASAAGEVITFTRNANGRGYGLPYVGQLYRVGKELVCVLSGTRGRNLDDPEGDCDGDQWDRFEWTFTARPASAAERAQVAEAAKAAAEAAEAARLAKIARESDPVFIARQAVNRAAQALAAYMQGQPMADCAPDGGTRIRLSRHDSMQISADGVHFWSMDYTDCASVYQHFAAFCDDLEILVSDYNRAVQQLDSLTIAA